MPESLLPVQADACNFIKKETLTQVFLCELCDIFKNAFSYGTLPVAASGKASITIFLEGLLKISS